MLAVAAKKHQTETNAYQNAKRLTAAEPASRMQNAVKRRSGDAMNRGKRTSTSLHPEGAGY